jgi:hypothetical protein
MTAENRDGLRFPRPETRSLTPSEEAKSDLIAYLQEAEPDSIQDQAMTDQWRWYEAGVYQPGEHFWTHDDRVVADREKIQGSINWKIAHLPGYEDEHDVSLVLIERYTWARLKEQLAKGFPFNLETTIAHELKAIKAQSRQKSPVAIFERPGKTVSSAA